MVRRGPGRPCARPGEPPGHSSAPPPKTKTDVAWVTLRGPLSGPQPNLQLLPGCAPRGAVPPSSTPLALGDLQPATSALQQP